MTGLFDTGPFRRDAILKKLNGPGVRPLEPIRGRNLLATFDRDTRDIITGALKEAGTYTTQAALELLECGEYDEADRAADIFETIEKLKARISHLSIEEEEE